MEDYQAYFEANRAGWNKRTGVHIESAMYDLEGWRNGKTSLKEIELRELGSVKGKSLLHFQCHFGQDTLSWARLGASVMGVDLSDKSIEIARQLAKEEKADARFICCNLFDLPNQLKGEQFDIVFTSYGTVGWLPELQTWGKLVNQYLKPGGTFYIADFHPVVWMMDEEFTFFQYPYHNAQVIEEETKGTYTDRNAPISYKEYGWNHSLSEIINSLTSQGLHIEFLNEYPYSPFDCFNKTVRGSDGNYRILGLENVIPMVYSIKANKPL